MIDYKDLWDRHIDFLESALQGLSRETLKDNPVYQTIDTIYMNAKALELIAKDKENK